MAAAKHSISALGLDRLLLIPDGIAPHKQLDAGSADPKQRLQMLRILTEKTPKWEVCPWEIQQAEPNYTQKTLQHLRAAYPEDQLVLCLGTDQFLTIHQWRNAENMLQGLVLAVLRRNKKENEEELQEQVLRLRQMGAEVTLLDNPVTPISSTDIRRMLAFRCAGEHLTPEVESYIRQNKLYGTDEDLRGLPMDALEQAVTALVKKNRVKHILGCRDTAVELAKRWGANEEDAARAALLHDVTKALSPALQLTLCRSYGTMLDDFSTKNLVFVLSDRLYQYTPLPDILHKLLRRIFE